MGRLRRALGPSLTRDGILAGVNWSGPRATDGELDAEQLRRSIEALLEQSND